MSSCEHEKLMTPYHQDTTFAQCRILFWECLSVQSRWN